MVALSQQIGADVPFFLNPRPTRVQGIGEILTPIELDLSAYTLLLVTPQLHIDTAWAYKQYDAFKSKDSRDLSLTKPSFSFSFNSSQRGEASKLSWSLSNDLELPILVDENLILRDLKASLANFNPVAIAMTGSGASFYALFTKDQSSKINAAREKLLNLKNLVFIHDF